ncbi:MAG: hypothetical protein WCN21_05230 [Comamonadaceae bacterium]
MSDKCTEKLCANIPDELAMKWRQRARLAGCTPSELLRDAICMIELGMTWGEHVTKDRREALGSQAPDQVTLRACK